MGLDWKAAPAGGAIDDMTGSGGASDLNDAPAPKAIAASDARTAIDQARISRERVRAGPPAEAAP